jgi:uncharacterized protein YjbI with pentapeptide repeats
LYRAKFVGADPTDAQLWWTDLFAADLTDETLLRTGFDDARLTYTRFLRANLTDASLMEASLVKTDFEGATLTGCNVYGIAAWDVNLGRATQSSLIIIPPSDEDPEPTIRVDSLEVAQFIYLLLNNEKLRDVIETMTSTAVLILGNFAPGRKEVLEAIWERLRERG